MVHRPLSLVLIVVTWAACAPPMSLLRLLAVPPALTGRASRDRDDDHALYRGSLWE